MKRPRRASSTGLAALACLTAVACAPSYSKGARSSSPALRTAAFPELWSETGTERLSRREPDSPGAGAGPIVMESDGSPFRGKRRVLIVGVAKYADGNYDELPNAARDAEALAEYFRSPEGGGLTSDRVILLQDEQATRAEVLGRLREMLLRAQDDEMVIFYFAGHGQAPSSDRTSERYLVTYDSRMNNPFTAIERDEIDNLLDDTDAESQVVMLDCCFSGGEGLRGAVMEEDPFSRFSESPTGKLQRRAVLTSTSGSETARDWLDGSDNSPFAHFLLRALRGEDRTLVDKDADGTLSIRELHAYVRSNVRTAVTAAHRQSPQLYGDPDLPVAELER